MSDYNYGQIKNTVYEWSQTNMLNHMKKQDLMEVTKNNNEALIIDLTFDFCQAQLVASNPSFAPYQYISFEAMTLDSKKAQEDGNPELVYFFYDTPKVLSKEVIPELERGVRYCSDYVPDTLRELYLNKYGTIRFGKKESCKMVHPNDISKIEKVISYEKYICIDTLAQYLVLNSNELIIRVLPEIFYYDNE